MKRILLIVLTIILVVGALTFLRIGLGIGNSIEAAYSKAPLWVTQQECPSCGAHEVQIIGFEKIEHTFNFSLKCKACGNVWFAAVINAESMK